ncbi:MAG: hypothetical protein A4E20_04810 [Nitrospira sp. SG-bin2]|uniref:hypothetical protein n=1 Tax=Nitrospira cf. moscoviensis SBR1015 TaxID=96242 RepID=UPI000A0D0A9B|nr:hypothetical protein [Nitrospira cf. moscoviensis SBR1015]OQW38098.1 MAG: hypothetical protein A4E20_04810 [Nitrospira sp. SG-bin2]
MATFEVQGPDGHTYEIEAPDQQSAMSAFKKMVSPPDFSQADAARATQDRNFQNLTGIETVDSRLKTGGFNNDYIREIPNTALDQARGALGNYVDAAMVGGADELLAGIESLPYLMPGGSSFLDKYNINLGRLEQQRRDYNSANSAQATAATLAGFAGNPLNIVGGEFIAAGKTAVPRAIRASGFGSAEGGVYGALGTEGGYDDRVLGGAIGLVGGGVAGLAGQPGMELLGFGARKGVEGGRAIYNTLKNQAEAKANPGSQADKLLNRALLEDKVTLAELQNRIANAQPGQGMVNLGGENTVALGRQATVQKGEGRTLAQDFFEEQAQGAPDRAADAVKGLSDRGYYGTVESLDATRKALAKPLYDAAYAKPSMQVWSPRVADLMKRPSMKAAFAKAQRIAAEEGRNPKELGLDFNDAGDPMFLVGADKNGQIPSMQTLDYVKRALDDVVEGYRDKTSGKLVLDTEGRAINNTRAEFLGILKEGNPEYKAALEAYAGPSHALDMLEVGRDIYGARGKPADVIRRFQGLSPQDQELARIGFVRNAIEDLGNVGDNGSVYLKLFGNSNKRAVAQVMFPDEASFNKFAAQMQAEKKMLAANRTVQGGSPTSRIDADKAAMSDAENTLGVVDAMQSRSIMRMLGTAMQQGRNLQQGLTPEVASELAKRLFTSDPAIMRAIASQLQNRPVPAPISALPPGWLRNTPTAPLLGLGFGQWGQAIATPTQ